MRREIRNVPVPPESCFCGNCNAESKPIGYEKREIWEYRPGEFYIIEERVEKRAFHCCQEGIVAAEGTPKPIESGRPGPGLLAQVVSAKFREGMPLWGSASAGTNRCFRGQAVQL